MPKDLCWLFIPLTIAFLLVKYWPRSGPPYPPGPIGDPVVGNARHMPLRDPVRVFCQLGQRYGPVVHLEVLGKHFVILNQRKPAVDLLEKKSQSSSGRPRFLLPSLLGIENALGFLDFKDERFPVHRRTVQRFFSKDGIKYYQSFWVSEAQKLTRDLIQNVDTWDDYLRRYAAVIIIDITYGQQVTSDNNEYYRLALEGRRVILPVLNNFFGMASTYVLPLLQHFPAWFPGAYWAKRADSARPLVQEIQNYPIRNAAKHTQQGFSRPCLLMNHLRGGHEEENDMRLDDFKQLLTGIHATGPVSMSATLCTFVATMVLFPDCQRKAQEEIDRAIGPARWPEFDDKENLKYVKCLVEEVLRWSPAVPLGLPHCATEDLIYQGMFIPEGSTLVTNIRAMSLDPEVYHDPQTFNPTRYLQAPEGRGEPYFSEAFGFGRRACPGVHLAKESLWIAMATILASLEIRRPVDELGNEFVPKVVFSRETVTCTPEWFPCRILPRKRQTTL